MPSLCLSISNLRVLWFNCQVSLGNLEGPTRNILLSYYYESTRVIRQLGLEIVLQGSTDQSLYRGVLIACANGLIVLRYPREIRDAVPLYTTKPPKIKVLSKNGTSLRDNYVHIFSPGSSTRCAV